VISLEIRTSMIYDHVYNKIEPGGNGEKLMLIDK
jgi:hypothetical protein